MDKASNRRRITASREPQVIVDGKLSELLLR